MALPAPCTDSRLGLLAAGEVPAAGQKSVAQGRGSLVSTVTPVEAVQPSVSATTPSPAAADIAGDHNGESVTSTSQVHQHSSSSPRHWPASLQPPPQQQSTHIPSHKNSVPECMRREWQFALRFVHQAAQVVIQCSPQWEYEFIDVDQTAVGLAQNGRSPTQADSTPMLTVLSYTDRTAVAQQPRPGSAAGNSPGVGASLHRPSLSRGGLNTIPAAASSDDGHAEPHGFTGSYEMGEPASLIDDRVDGDAWWVEKLKAVELIYCHAAPDMNLELFCKHCVQFILRDPHVSSVDGDTRLARLHMGDKLRCPYRLGGCHRSFQLRYTLRDRSELQESCVYAIGALVGQRGYLLRARCTDAEELEGYVRKVLLPAYATPGRAQFGIDVAYHSAATTTLISEQQEAFGELQYVDHKAAIAFVTPLYPMRVLLDYSPAKTVDVGSITCLTLKLSVYERLLDDAVAAEMIGVAKYKVSPIIMCVEVEEVSRMGYPKVMSTEQYSKLKAARVAEVFPDAKMAGLPTNLFMGDRTGRLRTMTFTYEPLRCVAKALITSTLVGNLGVTALYIAKLSGGVFDAHLCVFQQLLSGIEYLPQNSFTKNARVSRYCTRNIRLVEEDIIHAYSADKHLDGEASPSTAAAAAPHPKTFAARDPRVVAAARERHLQFLSLGNDGRVEGGIDAVVPPEEDGAVPTRHSVSVINVNAGSLHGRGGHERGCESDWGSPFDAEAVRPSIFSASVLTGSLPSDAFAAFVTPPSAPAAAEKVGSRLGGEMPQGSDADLSSSAHSSSCISVADIPHLRESDSASIAGAHSDNDDTICGALKDSHDVCACSLERASGTVTPLEAAAASSVLAASLEASVAGGRPPASTSESGDGVEARTTAYCQSDRSSAPIPSCVSSAAADAGAREALTAPLVCSASALPMGKLPGTGGGDDDGVAGRTADASPTPETNGHGRATAERLEQQKAYEQLVGEGDPAVKQALREVEGGTLYGPSLRDVYARCCEAQQCRPNSYLMRKLPVQPEFTYSVEEIDLSGNYVGHNGFVAVLHLLEHLPRLRVVYFNNMSLDNVDAESLCYALAANHTVHEVHLEHNPGISLPAVRNFTALLRVNKRIAVVRLAGTRLSPPLIERLQGEASRPRD
ncbi:hypothetical protein LSCM1_07288 [Leishmania martiniquensis]|uniref:Uncharacterized protein n=1 Tax=Leishmania martiniquensis TaxID=1580590 RepID=A0A836KX56_9TRYP|nr:hypothetical protein LSCM1_07288 [Leishmania martiniquensis]